jgi:hypothetical protein
MIGNGSKSTSAAATISYARPSGPKFATRRAVLAAWLFPAAVQLVGLLVLFKPYPRQVVLDYLHGYLASIAGFPLFAGITLGLIPPDSGIVTFSMLAVASWSVLLTVATTAAARRLPLWAHLALSCFWTFGGCLLWLGLAAW